MSDKLTIAATFKREPIWTEGEVGYVSRRHVPDWREAAKILAESVGTKPEDIAAEAERRRLAKQCGLHYDEAEDYFGECAAEDGEPFWKVEW